MTAELTDLLSVLTKTRYGLSDADVLKPCPFCGHVGIEPNNSEANDDGSNDDLLWLIVCGGCKVSFYGERLEPELPAATEALARWNKRA